MEYTRNQTVLAEPLLYRYTFALALGLASLQCLDGFLTGIGVHRFGIESEANPLLRELMLNIGALPALALVKLFAICCVFFMANLVHRVRWVPHAMLVTCGIYLVFAVLPWSYYLFLHPWLETATFLSH